MEEATLHTGNELDVATERLPHARRLLILTLTSFAGVDQELFVIAVAYRRASDLVDGRCFNLALRVARCHSRLVDYGLPLFAGGSLLLFRIDRDVEHTLQIRTARRGTIAERVVIPYGRLTSGPGVESLGHVLSFSRDPPLPFTHYLRISMNVNLTILYH